MLVHHAIHSAGVCYYIACCALDGKRVRDSVDEDAQQMPQAIYVMPVALLEALFAIATTNALRGSLQHLKSKGSSLRLNVYRCFAGCLAAVVACCIAYLGFELHFHATHPQHEKWQFEWVRSQSAADLKVSTRLKACLSVRELALHELVFCSNQALKQDSQTVCGAWQS